jgi:hypothetical protein
LTPCALPPIEHQPSQAKAHSKSIQQPQLHNFTLPVSEVLKGCARYLIS